MVNEQTVDKQANVQAIPNPTPAQEALQALCMARQLYWRVASITAFGVSPHLNFPRVNYKRFVSLIETPIQVSIERRK
jgi:hypothetical protein